MIKFSKLFFLVIFIISCTSSNQITVKSEYIQITLLGDINESDWLEVNDYRVEFQLPDKSELFAFNKDFRPVNLSDKDPLIGLIPPSNTLDFGPKEPVNKHLSKGIMLNNIAKALTLLSYTEYDSSIFDFKSNRVMALGGLLIFGSKNKNDLDVRYPKGMNILVKPYHPK